MKENEIVTPISDYVELAPNLADRVKTPFSASLKDWLDSLAREKKSEYLFELEMWINSFERFFRVKNHPLSDYEISEILNKDFTEELWVVQNVSVRMSFLCTEILTRERHNLILFERYIENELKRDFVLDSFLEKLMEQPSPEDSVTLLLDSLSDIRTIITDICKGSHVSYQSFTSIGRILIREIKRCKFIELLINFKFKPHYDKIQNKRLALIVKNIQSDQLRQHVAKVFLELFRLLNYLKFIEVDLKLDRPLKNSVMIFVLIRSELNLLADFLESKVIDNPNLSPGLKERIDAILYALRMEMKKVYNHELVGLVYQRQAQQIFVKVENSHGLIRDCLQNAIVQIAQAFDTSFDGGDIFQNLTTRLKESLKLREDLKGIIHFIHTYRENADNEDLTRLIDYLARFRDLSLKYLMYRDWDDYEKFMEEIIIASGRSEMSDVLHRFQVFLETLLGEVNKRAVLINYKPDDAELTGTDLLAPPSLSFEP